ncbi:hypothetical protein [Paenibacillus lentus]|uniref:Uncharacterized protein n=1 Tax=Paenibacillus lentus TaxID=1338368 RepID=A0A3Q8S8A5_9BACL|nr:hypothetical protein [Paenibacillus lentus]AZK44797.1 hypothetical protein EIM92_00140 [Paenibacillus lentus]
MKNTKGKLKNACWWLFVGFCMGFTPYVFHLAEIERGYKAIGGEIFIPLIPFLVWAIKVSINDMKTITKEVMENEQKHTNSGV